MCQKSSYESRCEDCNSRVIIHVVTHQVCNGKPPVSMTKAEKQELKKRGREIPYRKDGFICQRRIRPYKRYWSWVGSHACWYCSLRKQKNEAEEQLEILLADGNRTETEVKLKRKRVQELREQIMDMGVPEEDCMTTLPKRVQVDMEG
ncbi:hypothetical protein FPCIR_11017 [Fusarium pseudocircinatum]|uniref:Uncharacterized protein n=1 Tax=Fusarium pseudocircinatum TaxID=56676 RepID=A0A8H5KUM9_9HYPO|nr:hypothetical protein FPCIR_11017 [Fusarium pseudocircinatum]